MDDRSESDDEDVLSVEPRELAEEAWWLQWHREGDLVARGLLIDSYTPFAKMMAAVLFKNRYHDEVEFDEYFQMACVGLLEAIDRFNPTLGFSFKAFAARRIRGSILNGLDRITEKNQQIAIQRNLRNERLESVKEDHCGFDAPPIERDGDGIDGLFNALAEIGIGLALGVILEGTLMVVPGEERDVPSVTSPEVEYFRRREEAEVQHLIQSALVKLKSNESFVIRCHYQQSLSFEEIAIIMGLSRSRISQIHRKALASLRGLLRNVDCDVVV